MQFTISARGKPASIPIETYMRRNFSDIPVEQIDSFFGFTEASTLYGGRIFTNPEISPYDLRAMYEMDINLRLPLSNHYATLEEYKENVPFLEKYTVRATRSSSPITNWLSGLGRIFPLINSRPA